MIKLADGLYLGLSELSPELRAAALSLTQEKVKKALISIKKVSPRSIEPRTINREDL